MVIASFSLALSSTTEITGLGWLASKGTGAASAAEAPTASVTASAAMVVLTGMDIGFTPLPHAPRPRWPRHPGGYAREYGRAPPLGLESACPNWCELA